MAERKSVLLRLDPAVHDALTRWAGDELRSTNAQIEFVLRRALSDAGRLPTDAGRVRRRGRPRKDARPADGQPAGEQSPDEESRDEQSRDEEAPDEEAARGRPGDGDGQVPREPGPRERPTGAADEQGP